MAVKRDRYGRIIGGEPVETPQKTIKAAGLLAPAVPASTAAPAGQSWQDFSAGYGDIAGGIGKLSGVHNSKLFDTMANQIAKQIGFTGPMSVPGTYQFENANEGGTFMETAQGKQASPEFLKALEDYQFSRAPDKLTGTISKDGQTVGNFTAGNKDTGFDKFAQTAVPLSLALLGGAALGGYIPGAEIGAGSGAASAATGAAAADIGALGLAEGVYGAGGALGAGVEAGTIGGLAGSTAGFGGLGSVLPAGVGYGAAAAAGAAALPELSQSFGFDPAATQSANPFGGGLAPTVETLPTIGAETTAFGSVPELSALGAGAPVETAFGSFGGGLLAPEVAPTFTFDPSAPANANPLGGGLAPTVETLPAIGAETTAFGAVPELSAMAAGAPVQTAFGSFGAGLLAPAVGPLGQAAAWMKQNPVLGRLLTSGATSLLAGMGGGGSGGGQTAAPSGPPVQWNSPLQQGLLAPVQQYAPAAITQQRPAGLLAQGYQNDGAWRYLRG